MLLFLGSSIHPSPQETAGVWLDVPYVKQSEDGCGSAVISMLLEYWKAHGAHVGSQRADAAAIQNQLYSRKARGIHASDMESYLKDSGFRAFPLNGDWKDLLEQLKQGRPLIVSLQPGSAKAPLHYVVVAGIDCRKGPVSSTAPRGANLPRADARDSKRKCAATRIGRRRAFP